MRLAAALAAVLTSLAASPAVDRPTIVGNGQKTTEKRDASGFDAIALDGAIDAAVKVGPAHSVAVTIDSNLQPHVRTRLEGSKLVVDTDPKVDVRWRGKAKVEITLPALRAVSTSGSGDAVIEGGKGQELVLETSGSGEIRWRGEVERLDVRTSGSGDVALAGKAGKLVAHTSGSGDVRAGDLEVHDAEVRTSGSADVDLRLTGGVLRAWTSGSGDVTWSGEASKIEAHTSGSGDVTSR
jgi:hypothetical protein